MRKQTIYPVNMETAPAETRKDFFISYNKADQSWAEWIASEVQKLGYSVVIQAWHMPPGSNFAVEMHKALEVAERTIAVLSPTYLTSKYTMAEWTATAAQDPDGSKRKLVPIRVKECDPTGLLYPTVYLDLVNSNDEDARKALREWLQQLPLDLKRTSPFPIASPRSSAVKALADGPRFPGTLPPIWNVKQNRNPNFIGRGDLLRKLWEALDIRKAAALTPQAITGLGGVGKTQTAREFAYHHAVDNADYDLVWWMEAEKMETLSGEYGLLAVEMGLGLPLDAMADQVREAVRRELSRRKGWLLIFDNANRPEEIYDYLPQGHTGHVLITSRYSDWEEVGESLTVRPMKREESVALLLHRTRRIDQEGASRLAEALGDLPLALAQAGAVLRQNGQMTFDGYRQQYETRLGEPLSQGRPFDYPDSLLTTWNLSFEAAQKDEPVSTDLLRLLAFFAPGDITHRLFSPKAVDFLNDPLKEAILDDTRFHNAIAALQRYSLLEATGEAITIHRLVQEVTRDRMTEEEKIIWANAALNLVNFAYPQESQEVQSWPECAVLLPHALTTVYHAENFQVNEEVASILLNKIGEYQWGHAEFKNARQHFERALKIGEKAFGINHSRVAIFVNNLGSVLKAQGNLEEAKQRFERALEIGETTLGLDHPEVAIFANNLGNVLLNQGDLEGAKRHFERALLIDQAAYGFHHPNVAIRLNNLGRALQAQSDLEGAKRHFERALMIDQAVYSLQHPNVAIRLNNLGRVLETQGDLEGAKQHFERALEILKHFLGDSHPSTRTVQRNFDALNS